VTGSTAKAPAASQPLVTIVIVNWNGAHLLPMCLNAVRRLQAPFAFQTWVVDNASSDGSVQLLTNDYPEVRVLRSPENRGFAGGNNLALRQVTTPFVVLLNNDAVPEPDWLARLLAPFGAPGARRLGAVTGKVVFLPRYVALRLDTDGFVPGGPDSRLLGVRVCSVRVNGEEALGDLLWQELAYGPEGSGTGRFHWTRPAGQLLVPIPATGPADITFTWAADRAKPVRLSYPGGSAVLAAAAEPVEATLTVPAEVPRVDVLNNVGGVVLRDGYGADRGYQQVDSGLYGQPEAVFTACGNGMALRRAAGEQVGWFDDDFFLYYEDTDLSWRLRARGWDIRYEPSAVLRHVHAATSREWSPLFMFHVDRNRLLMLTKDATAALAGREVARYPLTTASMAVRTVRQAAATRRRPPVRPTLLRLRVLMSYLRLLPRMLARRRLGQRRAEVPARTLERRWLVSRSAWLASEPHSVSAGEPEGPEPATVPLPGAAQPAVSVPAEGRALEEGVA
jgi:GT2 family glycosyltransferase